jgi:signal transduction histidine kinase
VAGETFIIVAALDIGHEKRRQALEHIFLHDIYNVAYGLRWYTEFLRRAEPGQVAEFSESIDRLCGELIDEIDAQRILIRAETRELVLRPESLRTRDLLQDAVMLYTRHPVAQGRQVRVDGKVADVEMIADRTLLRRVLCNMIKNALEACRPGETVTAGCTAQADGVEFWVHNPGLIPRDVQLQIYQRFFSTKGTGRGLGTYSMKLLTERYLNGQVAFTTSNDEGTIFRARYPLSSAKHSRS